MNMESSASASRHHAPVFSLNFPRPGKGLLVQDLADLLAPMAALRHLLLLPRTALENHRLDGVHLEEGEGVIVLRPDDAGARLLRLRLPLHHTERGEFLRLPLDMRQRRARVARAGEPSLPPLVLLCLATEEGRRQLKAAVGVPAGGALPRLVSSDAALALLIGTTTGGAADAPHPAPHAGGGADLSPGSRIGVAGGEKCEWIWVKFYHEQCGTRLDIVF